MSPAAPRSRPREPKGPLVGTARLGEVTRYRPGRAQGMEVPATAPKRLRGRAAPRLRGALGVSVCVQPHAHTRMSAAGDAEPAGEAAGARTAVEGLRPSPRDRCPTRDRSGAGVAPGGGTSLPAPLPQTRPGRWSPHHPSLRHAPVTSLREAVTSLSDEPERGGPGGARAGGSGSCRPCPRRVPRGPCHRSYARRGCGSLQRPYEPPLI